MKVMTAFKKTSTSKKDWKAVLLVTAMTALGAGLTYLGENIGNLDLGKYTVFIVPLATSLIVFGKQWIAEWLAKPHDEEDPIEPIGKK